METFFDICAWLLAAIMLLIASRGRNEPIKPDGDEDDDERTVTGGVWWLHPLALFAWVPPAISCGVDLWNLVSLLLFWLPFFYALALCVVSFFRMGGFTYIAREFRVGVWLVVWILILAIWSALFNPDVESDKKEQLPAATAETGSTERWPFMECGTLINKEHQTLLDRSISADRELRVAGDITQEARLELQNTATAAGQTLLALNSYLNNTGRCALPEMDPPRVESGQRTGRWAWFKIERKPGYKVDLLLNDEFTEGYVKKGYKTWYNKTIDNPYRFDYLYRRGGEVQATATYTDSFDRDGIIDKEYLFFTLTPGQSAKPTAANAVSCPSSSWKIVANDPNDGVFARGSQSIQDAATKAGRRDAAWSLIEDAKRDPEDFGAVINLLLDENVVTDDLAGPRGKCASKLAEDYLRRLKLKADRLDVASLEPSPTSGNSSGPATQPTPSPTRAAAPTRVPIPTPTRSASPTASPSGGSGVGDPCDLLC